MNIHELRHYSATELITAGVDVRTVAGRLGHGGGGSTTLRAYAAWVSEADQRAAGTFGRHMPALPVNLDAYRMTPNPAIEAPEAVNPYQKIAAHLRNAITCGALQPGDQLPTVKELGSRYNVTPSTAHRAITKLVTDGLVTTSRGRRATVAAPSSALARHDNGQG